MKKMLTAVVIAGCTTMFFAALPANARLVANGLAPMPVNARLAANGCAGKPLTTLRPFSPGEFPVMADAATFYLKRYTGI